MNVIEQIVENYNKIKIALQDIKKTNNIILNLVKAPA